MPVVVPVSYISALETHEQFSRNLVTRFCPGMRTKVVIPNRLEFQITKWQTPEVGLYGLRLQYTHIVALFGYGKSSAEFYRQKQDLRFLRRQKHQGHRKSPGCRFSAGHASN
jgi:hypothetical protein